MSQVVTYFFIALFVPNTDSNNFEYEKNVTIPEAGLPRCSVHASCFLRRKCRLPQFPACRFLYDDVGQSRFASAEERCRRHRAASALHPAQGRARQSRGHHRRGEGIPARPAEEPLRIGCRPEKRPVLLHVDGWRDAVPECPGRYAASRRRQGETGRPACTHRREKRHCTPARGRCFGHRIGRGQLRERFVRLQRCGCHALFRAGVAGKRNRCR